MSPDLPVAAAVIGVDARRALSPGAGEIAAVFRSSFYVRIGSRLACVGAPEIGRGPLNMLLRDVRSLDWRSRLAPGQTASVRDDRLLIGGHGPIALAGAAIWVPQPPPSWSREGIRAGLGALDRLLKIHAPPAGGLGCFARSAGDDATPVARHAKRAVEELADWLAAGCAAGEEPRVEALLGLGPGLTPSGDDFIAGVLGALRRTNQARRARSLWRLVAPRLSACTHAISAAHLRCAANGRLAAAQLDLLDALITGDEASLRVGMETLAKESHGSSWDGLAGMATALRALVRSGR